MDSHEKWFSWYYRYIPATGAENIFLRIATMTLESVIMIIIWLLALVTLLALLSNYTHPSCGQHANGRGRRCKVHNGDGVWK